MTREEFGKLYLKVLNKEVKFSDLSKSEQMIYKAHLEDAREQVENNPEHKDKLEKLKKALLKG